MNKKYWSSIQCLKKFSEWFSIRTILTQADQVTHATLEFLGTFIVTSTRTKNQSVRVRNTINSTDTLEGNKLLFESLSCFRAKNSKKQLRQTLLFRTGKASICWQFNSRMNHQITERWFTFHSSRKLLFIAKFTSVFYPR